MSGGITAGLILAAICALGTNLGWLIKHRGARRSPRVSHRHPWRSVRSLLASRVFLAGFVIATTAGLLHIVALAFAPISVVPAVMAAGVVILAVLAEPISGWRVTARQWWGVGLGAGGLKDTGPPTPAGSTERTEERADTVTGLLTFTGFGLLVMSEFSDRLEADLGLSVFNLWIAASFAAVAVCVTALLGDTLLATIARRSGRRPSPASVTTLLVLAGAPATIGILIVHQSRPLALDGWIALTGSVFLIAAALAHHLGPRHRQRRS